ncbi:MAG: lysostaphin resistance A-like protein [Haloarculaceae archaeon]
MDGDTGTDGSAHERSRAGGVGRLFWNPSERRLRTPWRLGLGAVAFAALVWLVNRGTSAVTPAVAPAGPAAGAVAGVVLYLAFTAVLFGGLVAISYVLDRRTTADLGLSLDGRWWRDAGVGAAVGAALAAAVVGVELASGLAAVSDVAQVRPFGVPPFPPGFPVPAALALAALVLVAVSAFEELAVRGYLLTNLAEGLNGVGSLGARGAVAVATLATAALFGLLHAASPGATPLSVLNVSLFGVLLGLGYALTDRLGVSIGLHLAWNAFVGGVFGLPVSGVTVGVTVLAVEQRGPALVTGGDFGPEGGLVALPAVALGLGLLWAWARYSDAGGLRPAVAVPTLRSGDGD